MENQTNQTNQQNSTPIESATSEQLRDAVYGLSLQRALAEDRVAQLEQQIRLVVTEIFKREQKVNQPTSMVLPRVKKVETRTAPDGVTEEIGTLP